METCPLTQQQRKKHMRQSIINEKKTSEDKHGKVSRVQNTCSKLFMIITLRFLYQATFFKH